MSARAIAADIIVRVFKDRAFASATIDAELKRLSRQRDADEVFLRALRGRVTELVYGTLRHVHVMQPILSAALTRPKGRMDTYTQAVLLMAIHELWFMSAPAYAVVSEAVELVKRKRGQKLGQFVNAILRKIRAQAQPSMRGQTLLPPWLVHQLAQVLSPTRMDAVRDVDEPCVHLIVNLRKASFDHAFAQISKAASARATIRRSQWCPEGIVAARASDPRRLPGYAEGAWVVQNFGAQVVAKALRPAENTLWQRVADVCAGRGGKSIWLSQMAQHVTAFDLYASKLAALQTEMVRLGISNVSTAQVDMMVGLGGNEAQFDAALVDAPCTGTGTWHQKPELLLRLVPEDAQRMAEVQLQLLMQSLKLLNLRKSRLVYAVCSLTLEEGRGVAERFEAACRSQSIKLVRDTQPFVRGLDADADGIFRIGPWCERGVHGFQMVCWTVDHV